MILITLRDLALTLVAGTGSLMHGSGCGPPPATGLPVSSELPGAPTRDLAGAAVGKPEPSQAPRPRPFRFEDIMPTSGIDFVHVSGMTGAKQFPTANGSGVAVFDYDNDG